MPSKGRIDALQTTPRYIIFKLKKITDKEAILKKPAEENPFTYREANAIITSDFLETMQAKRVE